MSDVPPTRPAVSAPGLRAWLDPAALTIVVGGAVLILALWWLWTTPRATTAEAVDGERVRRIEERLAAIEPARERVAALEGGVGRLGPLEGRLRALEERPLPDPRPLEARLATQAEAAERAAREAAERAAAVERRLATLEGKPDADPSTLAPREALEALTGRLDRLAERMEAGDAQALRRAEEAARAAEARVAELRAEVERWAAGARPEVARLIADGRAEGERATAALRAELAASATAARTAAAEGERRLADLATRLDAATTATRTELEARLVEAARAGTADSERRLGELAGRLEAATAAARAEAERRGTELAGRLDAARTELATQLGAATAAATTARTEAERRLAELDARLGSLREEGGRVLAETRGALEARVAALAAAGDRTARLATLEVVGGTLNAGEPLGPVLGRLGGTPPPALARFAQERPPTEAQLRLSFEEAARAARAAALPGAPAGGGTGGVVDGALARLGGLVTVRRGDQVVWGDAAEGELERARRALEAGDLEGAVGRLDRLPPPARAAMEGWMAQARALLAARAALRALAG